jgi:Rrf2 family protein
VSAKVDYAVRAAVQLASVPFGEPVKGEVIAVAQDIPVNFLENILAVLRKAGIVASRRGTDGGYWLVRPADEITVAEIVRAVDGPLAAVRGIRPPELAFPPPADSLREVWVAARAALRSVLDHVTLADVAAGALPHAVRSLTASPAAWESPPTLSDSSG